MTAIQFSKTLLIASLLTLSSWSGEAAEIVLKQSASCPGTVVRLGDIAHIEHDEPEVAELWKEILLFPAPPASRPRTVRRHELAQLLAFSDETIAECRITGADAVQIHTGGVTAAAEQPEAAPKKTRHSYNSTLASYTQPNGPAPAEPASSNAAPQQAVVAIYRIERGSRINAEDVELRTIEASNNQQPLIADLAEVVGKEAVQALQAGEPIAAEHLQSPRLVRRGESVTIRSVAAGITITTYGRSTEDGSEGDIVQVELVDTRERIAARVTGVQRVEVYASSPRVASMAPAPAAAPVAAPATK